MWYETKCCVSYINFSYVAFVLIIYYKNVVEGENLKYNIKKLIFYLIRTHSIYTRRHLFLLLC